MTDALVPQASPWRQYDAHRRVIDDAIRRVLESGRYILGDEVAAFEAGWAGYVGVRHAIGVGSGTAALERAIRGLGIGAGDEVITTTHTAVGTVAAIEAAGATTVLVDVDDEDGLLDPGAVEAAVTARTRAIVPVHLYGQPARMGELLELARSGLRVGALGDAGCFSFYPTKNLGALGDGGMVVTDDGQLAARIRSLREYGWRTRYVSDVPGTNSRLDELQAAIVRPKLPGLDEDNRRRVRIAARYSASLAKRLRVPVVRGDSRHVYHLSVVRTQRRDQLQAFLGARGIGTAVHYPVPVHRQPAYAHGARGQVLPVAERLAGEVRSLPIYPELTEAEADRVIAATQEFLQRSG